MNKLIFYLLFFLTSNQGHASDDFQEFLSLLEAEERAPSPLLEGNNLTPEEDVFLTEEEVNQFSTQPSQNSLPSSSFLTLVKSPNLERSFSSQSEGSAPSIYPFGTSGISHPLQFYTTPLSFSTHPPLNPSPPFTRHALPSYEDLAQFFKQSLHHPFPPFYLETSLSVETPKKRKIREEEDHSFLEIVKRRRINAPSPFLSEEETALQKKLQIKREEFEKRIPYELTEDQKKVIQEVQADVAAAKALDRVLIAPVGAGKTEIAMHAALETILKDKQVAIICPRCALAQQHFDNFTQRFKGLAKVEILKSRYTTSERDYVYDKIEKGRYHIIIGTHSLLTPKAKFKKLGLVIIDEEQNFGIKQKEFLNERYPHTPTLILTVTPIPRTMHLIQLGYYQRSEIKTMPLGRKPIKVSLYPQAEIDKIIPAILQEKQRNGHVFFVTSKIENLNELEKYLAQSLPKVTFKILHSKMKEKERTATLTQFKDHMFDILLSTNIIGGGIDIPKANTIIIHDSDKFGLAELYQMRGRVGRSTIQASAIFLYEEQSISKAALARLQVIEKYADPNDCSKISEFDQQVRPKQEE